MKIIDFTLIACTLLMSGCATQNMQKWFLNSPAIGPQASPVRGVVIGSVESKTTVFGVIPDTMQVHFTNRAPDPSNRSPDGQIKKTFNLINDNLELSATEPGDYQLSGLSINTTVTNYDFDSWNKKTGHVYGRFQVGSGEVIYIGNLFIDPEGMTLYLRVDDRFDEMKAKLPAELGNRLVKRLITVPASITFDNKEKIYIGR